MPTYIVHRLLTYQTYMPIYATYVQHICLTMYKSLCFHAGVQVWFAGIKELHDAYFVSLHCLLTMFIVYARARRIIGVSVGVSILCMEYGCAARMISALVIDASCWNAVSLALSLFNLKQSKCCSMVRANCSVFMPVSS